MNKLSIVFLFSLMLLFLASCSPQLEGDLYIRDIDDILSGDELTALLRINAPIPSEDDCQEYQERYDAVWDQSSGFQNMEFIKCFEKDWDNFAQYELEVPIVLESEDREVDIGTYPIVFMLSREFVSMMFGELKGTAVIVVSNSQVIDELDALIFEEFSESFDFADTPPVLYLRNDDRDTRYFMAFNSFVNGRSVPFLEHFELESRKTLEIKLSDTGATNLFLPLGSELWAGVAFLGVLLDETISVSDLWCKSIEIGPLSSVGCGIN